MSLHPVETIRDVVGDIRWELFHRVVECEADASSFLKNGLDGQEVRDLEDLAFRLEEADDLCQDFLGKNISLAHLIVQLRRLRLHRYVRDIEEAVREFGLTHQQMHEPRDPTRDDWSEGVLGPLVPGTEAGPPIAAESTEVLVEQEALGDAGESEVPAGQEAVEKSEQSEAPMDLRLKTNEVF